MSSLTEWMEKATAIGGITPGGYRRVAKEKYVKVTPYEHASSKAKEEASIPKNSDGSVNLLEMLNSPELSAEALKDQHTPINATVQMADMLNAKVSAGDVEDVLDDVPEGSNISLKFRQKRSIGHSDSASAGEMKPEEFKVSKQRNGSWLIHVPKGKEDQWTKDTTKSSKALAEWMTRGWFVGSKVEPSMKKGGMFMLSKSFVADDGKPGKSLKETSTEELKATLAKLKPTDPGSQARIKAIKSELSQRTGPDFEKGKKQPSASSDLSPEKARQMLHDGTSQGKPITDQQRKFFGAVGGHLPAPKGKVKKSMSYENLEDFLEKAEQRGDVEGKAPDFKSWMEGFSKKKGMEKSMTTDELSKAGGPFIGPRGGKWADSKHTVPWDASKHGQAQGKEVQSRGEGDKPMAEELELTIVNEGQLHNQMVSIRKNLINKMAAGNYDHAQASKLWNYAVENGAKLYQKQWGVKIDKDTKLAVARSLSDQFHEEAMEGEHGHMLNKKNAKAMQGKTADDWKKLAMGAAGGEASKKSFVDWLDDDELAKSLDVEGVVLNLEDWLEKSGALPTGEPKMGGVGGEQGGPLADVGRTSGSSDSAAGPAIGAPGCKTEKLSEDDADVEGQMKPHTKPIESTVKKSAFPADQREAVAHEQAMAVSQLRKSQDVYVGPDPHPYSSLSVHGSGDADASELVKSDAFYHGNSPQVAPNRPIIDQSVLCKSVNQGGCNSRYSAALTACPDCGSGTVGHRHVPGGPVMGASTMILEKSNGPGSLLRRPMEEPDVKIGE